MTWNDIPFKGADPANYTVGRQGTPVRYITFHHIVGTMESCASAWANPARQGSSHFAVGERGAWQFVDTDNTAWCNGNWNSNLESISIEHEGDWRFGYTNEACIQKSAELVAFLRQEHPTIIGFQRHRDVSLTGTVCPGDLPCERIWDMATAILNPVVVVPAPAAPVPSLQITDVTNRMVVTNKDANVWNLDFTTWAGAQSVKVIPKGTQVEVSAVAKHPLGSSYYMTEYSFSKGVKNGINIADCDEIVVPVEPPVVAPSVVAPPIVPPIVEPPVTPEYPNWFITFWQKLIEAILNIFKKG
jgi:hypothetical protein